MSIFAKSTPRRSTRFSDFIRNAPSRDKKKVYAVVLEKASKDQAATLEKARKKQSESVA